MRKADTKHFEREGYSGDYYVSLEDQMGFNALRVSVHGAHPLKKLSVATRIYLVISGSGTFTIDGQTTDVEKDDLYIIKPGSEYEYQGQMELFLFNVSPTNDFQ